MKRTDHSAIAGKRTVCLSVMLLIAASRLAAEELPTAPIHVESHKPLSPRLTEWTLVTPALSSPTFVRVLLPKSVEAGTRYPVLYLLHGGADDYRSWSVKGDVERLTAELPLIVIMPDGGRAGWYTNWFNRGTGGPPEWETFHIEQLIHWVDKTFPTQAHRGGRAIAGLSMGGFGALSYAARHPDLFTAAAAFSGFVDIANPKFAPRIKSLLPLLGTSASEVFGDYTEHLGRWRAHNPVDLAENLRGMTIVLRTGNGLIGPDHPYIDPIERSVHPTMVSMHDTLHQLGIDHTWEDYGPAGHSWSCWKRSLESTLPQFMSAFHEPKQFPKSLTFLSAEQDVTIFGWRLAQTQPGWNLVLLKNASERGFDLNGNGDVRVTTPPGTFHAHEIVVAHCQFEGRDTQIQQLDADASGSVSITVSLRPKDPNSNSTDSVNVRLQGANAGSSTSGADSR